MGCYMNRYTFVYQCSDKMRNQLKKCAKYNGFRLEDGYYMCNIYRSIDIIKRTFPEILIDIIDLPFLNEKTGIPLSHDHVSARDISVTFA